jgi:CheY-like chemotaxis protein
MFSGHEEIPAIAGRLRALGAQLDRSLYDLRGWWSELTLRLEPTRDELARTRNLRSLGDTVGGLAHNFNNSLGAILGYTELLIKTASDEMTRRRLEVVRQIALEAGATVRQLQEFIARQPQVALGPVALQPVVDEALSLTEPRWRDDADRRGIRFSVSRNLDGAPPVDGNYVDLRDVFVRLILSALDGMPGGGTLGLHARGEDSGWVVVEFIDSGQGEPELSHESDVVERQGGSLRVSTTRGEGRTVTLRLLGSRYQIIPTASEPHALPAEQARRILLVDDDPRLLRALTDLLEAHGHSVTSAASGAAALTTFDPAFVDLVVTDLGMPGMTGWEVAAEVKSRAPHLPVFLLTGWGERVAADDRSRFVDRVIAKPVSADALLGPLTAIARSDLRSSA